MTLRHPRRQVLLRPLDRRLHRRRSVPDRSALLSTTWSTSSRGWPGGAYGLTFQDDDLFTFGSSDADRQRQIDRLKDALVGTGLCVPMVTTNLFSAPCSRTAGSRRTTVRSGGLPCARRCATLIRRRARRGDVRYVRGREGAEYVAGKDVRFALERYREAVNVLASYVADRGYDVRFVIGPKPKEPRGDILLPTLGHALAFIESLERPELFGVNPEVGHEQMAGLNFTAGIAQAPSHGSFSVSTSTVNAASSTARTSSSATATCTTCLPSSTCWRTEGPAAPPPTTVRGTSTTSETGVWESVTANMRTYLFLKERAAAFRVGSRSQRSGPVRPTMGCAVTGPRPRHPSPDPRPVPESAVLVAEEERRG